MFLRETQPAKSYDLSMLSSILGRCHAHHTDITDHAELAELTYEALYLLNLDKPVVPHTDPRLLGKFANALDKLEGVSQHERVTGILGESIVRDVRRQMKKLLRDAEKLTDRRIFLCNPKEIEAMFGFDYLWEDAMHEAEEELCAKDSQKIHPEIPHALRLPITADETRRLIAFVIKDLFDLNIPPNIDIYVSNDVNGYHLFWSITKEKIDYATPASYDRATQLSFDIPHNAAHIAHLAALHRPGVKNYIDDMLHRAYFESVAVLSEQQFVEALRNDSNLTTRLHISFDKREEISPEALTEWIIADRIFEARLRVARLLADYFTMQGFSFDQTVDKVAKKVDISRKEAEDETYKYYLLTGLGAMYALGSRRLRKFGIKNPKNAIYSDRSEIITTWPEFMQKVASPLSS